MPLPVTPNATAAARDLLDRIAAVPSGSVLSGQHNTPREISHFSDLARQITGRTPIVWGQDFGFSGDGDMDGVEYRQAIIDEAIRQHTAGSVVTLMWHAVRPTEDEPVTFDGSICNGRLADEDWMALLTEGTEVHERWIRQVDVIAGYLVQLRDADVPVLWRPYHEMNGAWFWWGGRPGHDGYTALYRNLWDRLVHVHGLDNLVWVWNANAPRGDAAAYDGYYPGHDVVDVLAADVYGGDYQQSHHDDLVALAAGRPVALGEIGEVPDPGLFRSQGEWAWFMIWRTFINVENPAEAVRRLYADASVLSRATQ